MESVTAESDFFNSTAELHTNASTPKNNPETRFSDIVWVRDTIYISIISSLEIPMMCLAIYAVFSFIKSKQATPVFVINLLLSDLILSFSILLYTFDFGLFFIGVYWTSFSGFYFMTCIAVERYIMIAHPVWHRSHRSVACLVCTSLTGWFVPSIIFLTVYDVPSLIMYIPIICYVVIVVCFVGACRALSHSISLTPLKKQLVMGPLFFVVMSYTFLILPLIIQIILTIELGNYLGIMFEFAQCLFALNPLVDCLLYVFMRSDAENIIRTPHCCSRLKRDRTVSGQTTTTDIQLHHV